MTKSEQEKQVQALKNLGLTDEEVAEVLADDEKIDKGEKLFELSEEKEQNAKQARQIGNTAGYTKPAKKEKPADTDKRELITALVEAVQGEGVQIANPEREFTFLKNGKKYKVVLSCPRS